MNKRIFITGNGTGVGKTLVAAIITEAFGATYWKPVQAGDQFMTDTQLVKSLVSNPACVFLPEEYLLKTPVSPHLAAEMENRHILLEKLTLPETKANIVIEGAGGLFSPLNRQELNIHMIKRLNAEVIVVVRHYLGSINHALLTIEALKGMKVPIAGLVFNGVNDASTEFIMNYSGLRNLLQIEEEKEIEAAIVKKYAAVFLKNFG